MCALLAAELSGSGEPLVLLHGIATDHHIWDTVGPSLAQTRRVVAVDLPGFGFSAPVGEGFDLHEVADRIVRGIAGRGVRGPFDLVGHSLGGGVAIMLAADHPRLIRRLVLVAPAGLRPLPASISGLLASAADTVLAARRRGAPLTDLVWGRRILLGLTAADGAAIPPTLARRMVEASATARRTAPALATITSADLRPALRQGQAPLGVIWGEADRTVPIRSLETITETRADAEVVRLRDAGHVPMIERPEAFVAALERLLDRLGDLLNNDTTSRGTRSTVM